MTGPPLRVPAEDHRAPCAHDLTGLHPWGGTLGPTGPTGPPTEGEVLIVTDPGAPGHDRVREPGARPRHPAAGLAGAVPVSQVTWTPAPHITADVPERHRHA
ncbi:hypothetical protein [Streptosporangium sp. NPDC023615]|uniref:hypothetical protein n=1 Tax=Streptosporangium sp. NPDC023615 TaxID=3154794 RepID=UPI00342A622C